MNAFRIVSRAGARSVDELISRPRRSAARRRLHGPRSFGSGKAQNCCHVLLLFFGNVRRSRVSKARYMLWKLCGQQFHVSARDLKMNPPGGEGGRDSPSSALSIIKTRSLPVWRAHFSRRASTARELTKWERERERGEGKGKSLVGDKSFRAQFIA